MMSAAASHYVPPKNRMEMWMNEAVAWLTRHGVSLFGSRILRVRGRSSGLWREVPVNPLTLEDGRYLVAPRGHTQWVRNMRVAGEGQLRLGRRIEGFRAVEIADDQKVRILREYLRRWKFEVGMFFDGVDAKASDEELLRIAPKHPVFRITST
jgi:hypothetical protein